MSQAVPQYSLHKASGHAFVYLQQKPHYLGKHGSPESKAKYQAIVGKWMLEPSRGAPYTPTPVTDGKYVYSVFYDGTVVAVDFSGKIVWKNSEVKLFSLHGLGASSILANGQVIMPFDGSSREETQVGLLIELMTIAK